MVLSALELEELSYCLGRKLHAEGAEIDNCIRPIADGGLFIWGSSFGHPGSINDLHNLDFSTIVEDNINERILSNYDYKVNNNMHNLYY